MSAYEREGANCHTLILCLILTPPKPPYKVSCMFAPTLLRSQQVAIITPGGLLGVHTSHSSNLKAH